jgi:hypothetical protein
MEFVDFDLAKKLKEKGYPQSAFGSTFMAGACYIEDGRLYANGCITEVARAYTAPTNSQVLDWLRKEHNLHFEVVAAAYGYNLIISDTPDKGGTDRYYSHANDDGPNYAGAWDDYDDCVLYGIEYILDNLI